MNIGITGVSGFLGSILASEAAERGWTVTGFSRSPGAAAGGAVAEMRSLADAAEIDLSGLDAVVHLAGEPIVGLWTEEKKRRIRESRTGLTGALVEAMGRLPRARRPQCFLSASAVGYYGDRGDEPLDESADPGFGFLASVCREWEEASAGASRLGVRVVNPRIGLVLGRAGLLKRLRPFYRLGLAGRLGRGEQWMSWIHVRDAARIFLRCAEEDGVRGAVNCVSPYPVRNRDFTRCYARVLRRKAVLPVPGFVLRRLPGGMGELFLHSQRADPAVMQSFEFRWHHPDAESALRAAERCD